MTLTASKTFLHLYKTRTAGILLAVLIFFSCSNCFGQSTNFGPGKSEPSDSKTPRDDQISSLKNFNKSPSNSQKRYEETLNILEVIKQDQNKPRKIRKRNNGNFGSKGNGQWDSGRSDKSYTARVKKAEIEFQKAVEAEGQGDFEKAFEYFEKANKIVAGYRKGEVYDRLAGYYDLIEASRKIKKSKKDEEKAEAHLDLALAYIQKAVHYYKKDAFYYINENEEESFVKRVTDVWLKKSLKELGKSLSFNPRNTKARLLMASVFAQQGNIKKAVEIYESIAEYDRTNFNALMKLGLYHLEYKNYDRALTYFSAARSLKPKLPDVHLLCGVCNIETGNNIAAKINLQNALELEPRFPLAHFKLAELSFKLEKYDDAILHFESAEKFNPEPFAPVNYWKGRCFAAKGQYITASQELRKAMKINPKYAVAYYEYGLLSIQLGDEEEGIKKLKEAVELDEKLSEAHERLAYYYTVLPDPYFDPPLAVEHAQQAIELTKGLNHDYIVTLAEAYYANEDYGKALKTIEKLMKNPKYKKIYVEIRDKSANAIINKSRGE